MMFKEALAAAIVKGQKTQTRRLPSDNPRAMWREQLPWRYPVGQRFTVNPGRGVKRVAECEVTGRSMATLGEMTVEEARAEGFPLTAKAGFVSGWVAIHGSWSADTRVHVVEFKRIGPDCAECNGTGGKCGPCFGTGIEVSDRARALIAQLESDSGGGQ